MTVEATPIIEAPVTTTQCIDSQIKVPREPVYYGKPVLSRQRAIVFSAGHEVYVDWIFRDVNGDPVDLTSCRVGCIPDPCEDVSSSSSSESVSSLSTSSESLPDGCEPPGCNQVKLRFREILDFGSTAPTYECCGEVTNACNGKVRVNITDKTICPGVYWAEIAVCDDEGCPILSNVFRLVIERSLWAQLFPKRAKLHFGPPTLAEIRLHLRDSSAEESLLLDHIRFDDAEVALAIVRPIEYWNEIPPPLQPATTANFPHRFHWMDAIAANLFLMVEEQFRANNLSYSAAGVQVNDQDKEQNYARAAERRWASWKEFVKRKKSQLNLDQCWGEVASGYQYVNNYGGKTRF
jgi:hypothetical protein